eukprot:PITA_22595
MAVLSIGAIVTTTNPLHIAAEIAKQARDSAAVLAFATPSLAVKLAATKLAIVLIFSSSSELASQNDQNYISTLHKLLTSNPAHAPVVKLRQDDTATLLYSSGTTGMSKGVISTHRNLIAMVCIVLKRLGFTPENSTRNHTDSFLGMVPMFHIYGLAAFACELLGSGSTIVVLSKFDLVEMLRLIQKYRITYLPLVPPILLGMNKVDIAKKYDLSSLHTVICGGVPLSKESTEEFISGFPGVTVRQCYGLTETMGTGASTDSQEESSHYGTAGLLSPNTEAKIVDPVSGTPLPPNQKGELWLCGPYLMKGYFSNPEATSSTLDLDGWL